MELDKAKSLRKSAGEALQELSAGLAGNLRTAVKAYVGTDTGQSRTWTSRCAIADRVPALGVASPTRPPTRSPRVQPPDEPLASGRSSLTSQVAERRTDPKAIAQCRPSSTSSSSLKCSRNWS